MPSSDTQFKQGNPGGGRSKGARNKLSEAFIKALADDFIEHGEDAINRVRGEKPEAYLGTIAKLMPKLMELSGPDGDSIPLSGVVKYVKSTTDK